MRILLIEDEPLLGDAIATHLKRANHAVDWVQRLDDGEAALRAVDYGLVLLDLHLPDGRGLDLLRALRAVDDNRPVIILTARDQIRDRIDGLNAGADDYLVKPFDLDELVARIAAVQRRSAEKASSSFRVGDLVVDQLARKICRDGAEIQLTAREWAVLDCLAGRLGATFSRAQLEESLYAFGSEIESNAVEVYVSRLRKKLGTDVIRTVRGVGYRLDG
ncbi:two-component system response regulator [Methyloceanibacter methanicus]|uniref:Two-component system response regulator n=1 Tax=Methyloceanibacter methanicus TaxID=1774968 RepID=A0A1E3W198_9HYPH|nr:response regulator transcription factor [Methyloceanibacter methanicus]ODR99291.1 two-component system response regulator [Methyloceanibacter methanicus]